jgi:DNA-directed RNA polymerase specialized sigma24 family protein
MANLKFHLAWQSGLCVTLSEAADALHISESTVKRDWTMARTWLSRELQNLDSP